MHQKLPSQTLLPSRQRCMVWRYHDGRQRFFYWSILAAFLNRSLQSLIVDRDQNQSFCLTTAAYIIKDDSNSIKYTSSFLTSIWTLWSFVVSHLASATIFLNITVVCYPFFIAHYQSFQKWLNFLSFQQQFSQMKICSIKFFSVKLYGIQT